MQNKHYGYLSAHTKSKNWLLNFESQDRYILSNMLDYLQIISYETFRNHIEQKLINFFDERKKVCDIKSRIGLMLIEHPTKEDGGLGYGSEALLGNILRNIGKKHPRMFFFQPTLEHINSNGIKDVIFVDDILGSGTRCVNFFNQQLPLLKTLRSLESFNKINISILSYVAYDNGLKIINKKWPKRKIMTCIEQPYFPESIRNELEDILPKYGASIGYKNTCASVIFFNSIPNNTPSILWRKNGIYPPLFESCDDDLIRDISLSKQYKNRLIEIFWNLRQYNFALNLCDRIMKQNNIIYLQVSKLLLRGIAYRNLGKYLSVSLNEIDYFIKRLTIAGFLKNNKITSDGKIWLNKCINGYKDNNINIEKKEILYYPRQFRNKKL